MSAKRKNLQIRCPFKVYGEFECTYMTGKIVCNDIESCPSNSDAFCAEAVKKKIMNE